MEEIIERALKYLKNKPSFDFKEMVNTIMFVRHTNCFFELLSN
jgi:hypothetical protein